MTPPPDTGLPTRRLVYGLLITLAAGLTAGRIASAERLHEPSVHKPDGSSVPRPAWPAKRPEPSPTFSSNDRSRWAAARALVENGTFVVGRRDRTVVVASGPAVLAARDPVQAAVLLQAGYAARVSKENNTGIIFEEGYESVDKVMHPTTMEFYSTKPPLLTLLMACEYWVLKNALGWSVEKDSPSGQESAFKVVRTALVLFNLVPLVVYLVLLAWLAERFGRSDWSRYFVVAAGGFATLVTPFLITLNNHTPAVLGVAIVLYAVVRIADEGARWWLFVLAGLAAGFTACMELPALALAVGVFVYLAWNALSGLLRATDLQEEAGGVGSPAWRHLSGVSLFVLAALVFPAVMLTANVIQLGQLKPAYAEFGGPWYEYEGSHWRVPEGATKRGIDFARRNGETRAEYAFHLLIGHHGVFSLMPVMLLAVAGMVMGAMRWSKSARAGLIVPRLRGTEDKTGEYWGEKVPVHPPDRLGALLGTFSLLVSLVVVGFYLFKSDNYGGWSNGPRWLMWLSPLWLVCMLPALDALAKSRAGRLLALALLGLSILSMSYQNWNPWRHPWIYNWMEARDWIRY